MKFFLLSVSVVTLGLAGCTEFPPSEGAETGSYEPPVPHSDRDNSSSSGSGGFGSGSSGSGGGRSDSGSSDDDGGDGGTDSPGGWGD